MDHPFDKLSIKDEQLVLKTASASAPYMDTESVKIVRKVRAEAVADPAGYGKFSFELNAPTDSVWQELFYQNVDLNRDAAPNFYGKLLILVCDPMNVEDYHQKIQMAIERADPIYKSERQNVIVRVQKDMSKAALAAQEKATAQRAIEAAFDRIKLK
jgi:hypothetical protein